MKTPSGGSLSAAMLAFLYFVGFLQLSQAQITTTVRSGGTTANATTTTTAATTAPGTASASNTTVIPTTNSTQLNATNVTMTETTATTTTAAATTTTSVPATSTTLEPSVDLKHNIETSVFSLSFTIGATNTSDIQYLNQNLTRDEILEKMTEHFLRIGPGIHLERSAAAPSSFALRLDFLLNRIHNSTSEEIMHALQNIYNDSNFSIPNMNDTQLTVEKFTQSFRDVCTATNVCPPGFTCNPSGCEHMCRKQDCNNHGTCAINVLANSGVELVCKCEETYSTKYEGDHCESSSMGSDKIIAIVAGVLGAACLLFFLLFIVACVLYYRKRTNFNMSYDDFFNSTYHNTPVKVNDISLNGVH